MTSAPSAATTPNVQNTLNCSEALPVSLSSQADSHARIFPPLEKVQALREVGRGCGVKWQELSAKYDPDSHSWKTHRCLFSEDLAPSSVTLPKWGMMLDGVCWELMMPERHTGGNESGLWRTPMACDWKNMDCSNQIYLQDQVKIWPTPTSSTGGPEPDGKTGRKLTTHAGGQLNPNWVELLMGWPKCWTSISHCCIFEYNKWLRGFSDVSHEKSRTETVRSVWKNDESKKTSQRKAGRCKDIQKTEVLFSLVREHPKVGHEIGLALAGKKVQKSTLRMLWNRIKASGTSFGQRLQELGCFQFADFVHMVSQVYPSYGKEAWQDGTWEFATNRVEVNVKNRVDRLKAIGNGQVPAVAALAWQTMTPLDTTPAITDNTGEDHKGR
jgi:hypothetical protein